MMSDETTIRGREPFSEWQKEPSRDPVWDYSSRRSGDSEQDMAKWESRHHRRRPLRFGHIEKAIDDSVNLTYMQPDWDDAGAKVILESTWQRAGNALRSIARTAFRRYRYSMPTPAIGPCADGSIDLYWNDPDFTLLINVKEHPGQVSDFYGEREGSRTEGKFDPESPDLSFLGSLLRT